ncbi:MAG: tetratricopeptide repeat protein [Chloroflexi bacterium]|nr:tetratricopeptide repeat protein [Chloroflexota bacterium]
MQLQASLFGSPQFQKDDQPLLLRRRKVIALLTYLVVTGQPHSRDVLATLFWPENDQSSARANLRRELSRLRQQVGDDILHIDRTQVATHSNSLFVDIADFQAKIGQVQAHQHAKDGLCSECVAALQTAVSIYKDDFMAGFALPDSPEFDEWQFFLREGYRQTLGVALQKLIIWFSNQAGFIQGIEYGRRWVALDPLHEPAQRQLMQLYAWDGQQAAALRQYQECNRLLNEELGVKPEAETIELAEAIRTRKVIVPESKIVKETAVSAGDLNHHPLPDKPSPFLNIPSEPTPFLGQEDALQKIQEMLANPDCRLLSIIGLGGMGKSRLAIEAAKQAYETELFLDGVAFISLVGVTSTNALPNMLADALNLRLTGSGEPLAQLINLLKRKAYLLLLDNFEHLLTEDQPQDAGVMLDRLLTKCPKLNLLVTSREPLQMASEWRHLIEGLPFPDNDALSLETPLTTTDGSSIGAFPAVRLLVQTAVQITPDFTLTKTNSLTVCRICELAQGMPLAIKLATAWLRAISLERIVAEMERSLNILTSRWRDLPPRQRSMRAIFDYSWELLIAPEQDLFQALSVFRGGFTEEAAEKVAYASPFLLVGLVDKGLVQVQRQAENIRYHMHELTRQYAFERLSNSPQMHIIFENHARYFDNFVQMRTQAMWEAGFNTVSAEITAETHNVHHAWEWVLNESIQHSNSSPLINLLSTFGLGMKRYYYLKRPLETANTRFIQISEAMAQAGWASLPETHPCRTILAQYQVSAAFFCVGAGNYVLAEQFLTDALPQLRQFGGKTEYGFALTVIGIANLLRGQRPLAHEQFQESLAYLKQSEDTNGIAYTLKMLGVVAVDNGKYEQALTYYQESLDLYESIGYKPGMVAVIYNMGIVLSRQERIEEAKARYEQSLQIAKEIDYPPIIMQARGSLGGINRMLGRYDLAKKYYEQGIEMAYDIGRTRFYEVNLRGLGLNYLAMNDLPAAESTLKKALRVCEEMDDVPELISGITSLAQTWARQGKVDEALKLVSFVSLREEIRANDKELNDAFLAELAQELRPFFVEEAAEWAKQQTVADVLCWMFE